MRFNFVTYEQYTEAWRYLMSQCWGFTYSNNEDDLWIEPVMLGDPDDSWTVERLKEIQAS